MASFSRKRELFFWICLLSGFTVLLFILIPIIQLMSRPSAESMLRTILDGDVVRSIQLSMGTSLAAATISFVIGTPFAYLLARSDFRGKGIVESIIDLPIMIPHPIVGIALLSIAGREHWIGKALSALGIRIMGSVAGIVTVLTFVGLPFYISAAKNGFEAISPRLESISRSLGASATQTFFRITFPLATRSILAGFIMCTARAISEFGAVIIIAYHPMNAPVLIYERFESYGLVSSLPICVLLLLLCLGLFIALRIITSQRKGHS
ncbi:MAG: ABC transporter permease [Spirochaetes bacterium]|nr:ABC transporter permease [Spirochaetota bacterium]